MNKLIYLICAASCLVLSGCQSKKPKPIAVKVEAAEAIQKDVQDYIDSIGNVYEYSIIEVRPQVQGTLLKAYVQQGDFVKPGDLLFQIDPRTYKQALQEAEATLQRDRANLQLAESTVKRYTEAAEKDYVAPLNFEQFLANLAEAQALVAFDLASVEIAKINLDYTTICSPIAGKVGAYNVYPGNLVVVDNAVPLITIRQMSPINIQFSIPQRDFQQVQRDETTLDYKFEVFLPYEENRKFLGSLYFLDNHVDLQTGMIVLKGYIPNTDLELWPGQFVRVRLFTRVLKNALVVPRAAVNVGQQGHFVYRIQEDDTVEAVPVTMGPQSGDDVALVSGDLRVADKVVTNGQLNLRNGALVTIVNPRTLP